MAVVTDVDPNFADSSFKHRIPVGARCEIELLPEPFHLRDVLLAVLTQITTVGIDDCCRVVIQTWLHDFVHRQHEHHSQLFGDALEALGGRAVRNLLGVVVILRILHLAEVRAIEQFLKTHHLCTLFGSLAGRHFVLIDHLVFAACPIGLQQCCFYYSAHAVFPLFDM